MEEAYSNLNNAYLQIKGMIVVEGFYALVAGFVITTFVFKLAGIIKEMVHEGKGFNAKQFYYRSDHNSFIKVFLEEWVHY